MGWTGNNNDQWIDYFGQEWGAAPNPFTILKQIWTDDTYVYAATTDGLNIIDLASEQAYAYATYSGGFNSVWADDDNVYLATSTSGIKYIDKTCISGSTGSPYELLVCLTDYLNEPEILSDMVRYIHGNNGHMVISTASGINYRGPDLYYQRAQGYTKLSRKVFITPTGKIYYTTWDGISWRLNVKYANNQDWSTPDKIYSTAASGIDMLDIFASEYGSFNTIFIATTSGVQIIDEDTDTSYVYYTGVSGLAGTSNIFTSVWADTNASITNGKMYTLSWGVGMALSVLDLGNNNLYDHYTQTSVGRVQEILTNTDTRDLNVDSP